VFAEVSLVLKKAVPNPLPMAQVIGAVLFFSG
jgi:hypothetical protein